MATKWHWYYCDAIRGEADSRETAEDRLAMAMGLAGRAELDGMAQREGGGGETYYYATEEEADKDSDGAYAPAVYPADSA